MVCSGPNTPICVLTYDERGCKDIETAAVMVAIFLLEVQSLASWPAGGVAWQCSNSRLE